MGQFICAIDQGTTGTTVIIIDGALEVRARVNQEFPQIFPKPGWVEHDPEEIWKSTLATIERAQQEAGITPEEIVAVGITNQRETTVVWERESGKPIHNAIVWQDRRTRGRIQSLADEGKGPMVQKRTGLVLDPYFSGTKIEWILDRVEGARAKANKGELAVGTIDAFLLWRLTGGSAHKTDVSNASRTMLMNLATGAWDEELLSLLNVPAEILPEIVGNSEFYGEVRGIPGLADGTPVCGMAGDQQAALFGQTCFSPGDAKCTFGTGAFLLMNTGNKIVHSAHRMLTTAAWQLPGQEITYALEGSAFIAGALVQWLRDGLGFFKHSAEIEELAATVESSDGVVLVPSLAGLGAPHWNADARGVLWGMTRGTTRAHVARAALEAIALQNVDILKAMESDLGQPLKELKVDGGASANGLLMQLQADLLDRRIERPEMTDTTALGSALLAGLHVGVFEDLADIEQTWEAEAVFTPDMTKTEREQMLALWEEGLRRV